MIGQRAPTLDREFLRELLGALARGAIDDAALAAMLLQPFGELAGRIRLRPHREKQIRPVETAHEHAGFSMKQALDDIPARRRVGSRRHRDRLGTSQGLGDFAQAQVLGAEIVAPLRDAMGLVDREQIDREPAQHFQRVVARQALGRDIEQTQRAIFQRAEDSLTFDRFGRRIQRRRGDAELPELGDLVAHQGDQRRDDQRQAFARQRRKLEAERFAAAGRHDREHVLAPEHRAQNFLLAGAKAGKAEDVRKLDAGLLQQHFARAHRSLPAGSKTGVHCTSSMRSAPQASITSRSKPSAAPLDSGISASAARKSSSSG